MLARKIPRKFHMQILQTCLSHLSDVATLPWEIQKKIIIINRFVQRHKVVTSEALKSSSTVLFVHTSDYLCCLRRKQTVIHLPTATWKCHHTNLWTAKLFHLTEGLLHSFKRWASCGLSSVALKRTSCDVWQLECQASNVTASGSKWPPSALIGYMLPVLFDTVRSHTTPRCAEIQPMLQQATAASRNMSISIRTLLL